MGHVHMNVRDIEGQKKLWMTLGATPIRVGKAEAVKLPGMLVIFRQQEAGPMEGSVLNHLGVKVPKFADILPKLEAAGFKVDAPRNGSEPNQPQTNVYGPDQFRLELTEDPSVTVSVISHHLHFNVPDPTKTKEWYAAMLFVKPGRRANWEAGDVPGMNLTFAQNPQNRPPAVPSKGRLMDHVGFEVPNVEAFLRKVQANGLQPDAPARMEPELQVLSVLLTDPWGTSIELTQGLTKF